MAWTQEEYDALKAAMATGALKVEYADKKVEYRSLKDMRELLSVMAADLGLTTGGRVKKYSAFSSGNFPNI